MKRRIRGKLFLILILIAVCGVFAFRESGKDGILPASAGTQQVASEELAGYLAVIPLSPQETRTLILPDLEETLSGGDIRVLFEKLNLSSCYQETADAAAFEEDKPLSRTQWTTVYELMLDKLGVKEQVSEVDLQYLGDVKDEDRIITDSGNYDCDLQSLNLSYGKVYKMYLYGNFILGIKSDGNEDAGESEQGNGQQAQGETAGEGQTDAQQTMPVTDSIENIPETVRVLITQDNGQQPYRSDVWVKCSGGLKITSGSQTKTVGKDKIVDCAKWMDKWNADVLTVQPSVKGKLYLTNASGKKISSGYRGVFQIHRNQSGCWVVNELTMESYLYGVVPGEMPQSFAIEALKAQAVCARTYACRQISGKRYETYGADLDDTTDCQVYQTSGENSKAKEAVDATKGQVLTHNGKFAQIYYFSTSCGYTSGMEVWQQEDISYLKCVSLVTGSEKTDDFDKFIKNEKITAYDSQSHYFRWKAVVDLKGSSEKIQNVLQQYADEQGTNLVIQNKKGKNLSDCSKLGACKKMTVKDRADSGVVTDLIMQFSKGTVHIYNENTIRTVLGVAVTSLKDKNGDSVNAGAMLPSAAFTAEKKITGRYSLYGGGLGHSIGMSQYGADGMAKAGMSYKEILGIFFEGTTIVNK